MVVTNMTVSVTDSLSHSMGYGNATEYAARDLLKKKLHNLVDKVVDDAQVTCLTSDGTTTKYQMRIGYDRREKTK